MGLNQILDALEKTKEFDWDKTNIEKNWQKHQVKSKEREEVFLNEPLLVSPDEKHSTKKEKRFQALGRTNQKRKLFIAFTIRKNKIRVISARDQSKKERKEYGQ